MRGFFRSLVDGLPTPVCRWWPDTTITWANAAYTRLFGGGRDLVGTRWIELVPDEERDQVEAVYRDLASDPRTLTYEHGVMGADGKERWIAWTDSPVAGTSGTDLQFQSIGQDLTELRAADRRRAEAERELLQAHQMETVGRLAGGVAHEFNTLLGVILGRIELGLESLPTPGPAHAELREAREAAERAADLVQQLLGFARLQAVQPRALDLNDEVAGFLAGMRRQLGREIELAWEPGAQLSRVRVDPAQLRQALETLILNARDALEGAGLISVSTTAAEIRSQHLHGRPGIEPGPYVRISVRDTGRGMDAGTMARLFEPFSTLRADGRRSGLDLAATYGIVSQNGGFLDVESAPGVGTTFELYLPALPGGRERGVPVGAGWHERPQGPRRDMPPGEDAFRPTVLLVEDEPEARQVAARLFERLGYDVISASTPVMAVEAARDPSVPIDLLVTDLIMPDMHGGKVVRKIREMRSNLPCLVISGYPEASIARHGMVDPGVHLLPKPFTVGELEAKLREVMGEPES